MILDLLITCKRRIVVSNLKLYLDQHLQNRNKP